MADNFQYDVFLSHSSKDKVIVRDVAERLKKSGLKIWFDEWEIKPGDSIPSKIEQGLEKSRVLLLCMSANAFGSDWAQLESHTFRFRDPLNKERRFVPFRLDDTPVKGSLAQFLHINWFCNGKENEYEKLLEACRCASDRCATKPKDSETNTSHHLARVVSARRSEWKRLRTDFEAEAQKYHDVKMSVFYIAKDESQAKVKYPEPNYAINLWQYCGSTGSKKTMDAIRKPKLTNFGIEGAELTAYGLMVGERTDLFCRMARRAGSLLPDEINYAIADHLFKIIEEAKEPGKPVVGANSNALAKWLN